ncbi:4-oxalocrotonate decarboxylase [Kibdelosporangium philippinense]|uniref:4-oxalocrotonate decarboxylase n=1 Tax=Kibdelosporangium philippinense TaxID=211113 RepID=A0ABS8ZC32_9PSEU|nr:4-oxalocrotonate decarboxylase [Kibdelosporangium philippinense]MCE7004390.1 4-oxalocrotonate decarboxylase [Kibdelosporangium philippinense]
MTINDLANRLDHAAISRTPCDQLGELTLNSAYEVQRAVVNRRLNRGERLLGVKLGFTSRAKAAQMGVSDVIAGQLTSGMLLGHTFDLGPYIHPRIEPEIAFLMGHGGTVQAVAPALEIIDSRYRDFTFALSDVVADNASAAGFVIGEWQPVTDVSNRDVLMQFDGQIIESGSTNDILGDPMLSIEAATRLAAEHGIPFGAGSILLAGAATPAVAITPGTRVTTKIESLGELAVSVG